VIVACASVLIYGALETTALKAHCVTPSHVTIAHKTVIVPAVDPLPFPLFVTPKPKRVKPAHRIAHPKIRKHRPHGACGSEHAHWYWKGHRRKYRCR
jgi:hypothetical protein